MDRRWQLVCAYDLAHVYDWADRRWIGAVPLQGALAAAGYRRATCLAMGSEGPFAYIQPG